MTEKVTIILNGKERQVSSHLTIMQAAQLFGIHIPRLCYHPHLSIEGACRVCIVKVEGVESYLTSCSTKVAEGMKISTHSPEINQSRRDIVELILDNHPRECQLCIRNTNCELQSLAFSLGVRERFFQGKRKRHVLENSSHSIVRDAEKCILCGRCVRVCKEVQGVCNLSQQGRGFDTIVTPAFARNMDDSVCIQCGQCINVCPTAAFQEKRHIEQVIQALNDSNLHVVVQTAPSIRAALAEEFNNPPGIPCTGKMVTALKKIGFDAVFDTDLGADLTIVEESNELMKRLRENRLLPLITSCSPGWVNFMEKFYPEVIPHASTCRSPMSMLSSLIKTYYAEKISRPAKEIYSVAIMPCVAKKYEIEREEHYLDGIKLTDAVLTTRELGWLIKNYSIDFMNLPDTDFDQPLGESTGGGAIFGTTGGVMEAALRSAAEVVTGKSLENVEFKEVRAVEGLCEKTLKIGDLELNIGVANGLVNAKTLLDNMISGKKFYHVIEIMACPGGCIGGGGQPYPPPGYHFLDPKLLAKRAEAIYQVDLAKKIRVSRNNPTIRRLYKEFLKEPGSDISHRLLHTHYQPKCPRGI